MNSWHLSEAAPLMALLEEQDWVEAARKSHRAVSAVKWPHARESLEFGDPKDWSKDMRRHAPRLIRDLRRALRGKKRTRTVHDGVRDYLRALRTDSPIVPRSHSVMLKQREEFGVEEFTRCLEHYFQAKDETRQHLVLDTPRGEYNRALFWEMGWLRKYRAVDLQNEPYTARVFRRLLDSTERLLELKKKL